MRILGFSDQLKEEWPGHPGLDDRGRRLIWQQTRACRRRPSSRRPPETISTARTRSAPGSRSAPSRCPTASKAGSCCYSSLEGFRQADRRGSRHPQAVRPALDSRDGLYGRTRRSAFGAIAESASPGGAAMPKTEVGALGAFFPFIGVNACMRVRAHVMRARDADNVKFCPKCPENRKTGRRGARAMKRSARLTVEEKRLRRRFTHALDLWEQRLDELAVRRARENGEAAEPESAGRRAWRKWHQPKLEGSIPAANGGAPATWRTAR